jgi:hypothetical protein
MDAGSGFLPARALTDGWNSVEAGNQGWPRGVGGAAVERLPPAPIRETRMTTDRRNPPCA